MLKHFHRPINCLILPQMIHHVLEFEPNRAADFEEGNATRAHPHFKSANGHAAKRGNLNLRLKACFRFGFPNVVVVYITHIFAI